MALRQEELARLRLELGYPLQNAGADAYVEYVAVFDRAVQPYLIDLQTTSSTAVTASTATTGGTSVAITLASNPAVIGSNTQTLAFVQGSSVVVDVGAVAETSVIQSLSGLVATMYLTNAHSGTYPVLLRGGEQFIRDIFARIDTIANQIATFAPAQAGVKKVDEIELFGSGGGRVKSKSRIDELFYLRDLARRDLALAIGVPYLVDVRKRGGTSIEVY